MKKIFFFFFVVLHALPAQADQPIDLVRALCIHEKGMGHFSLFVESFEEVVDYLNGYGIGDSEITEEQRIKILRTYGLIFPYDFSYECQLQASKYRIVGDTPSRGNGECGDDPRTHISLYKEDQLLLDNMYVIPSCFLSQEGQSSPYIEKIVVDEGIGGYEAKIYLHVSSADNEKPFLIFLDEDDLEKVKPITQKHLECIARNATRDHYIGCPSPSGWVSS